MIPQRLFMISLIKAVFYGIIYVILEYNDSFYPNLINRVMKNTTSINPYNMSNITGFVYFSVTSARYPTIYDDYLNLTVFGAVIKRSVKYCQYEEKNEPLAFFTTSLDIKTYPNVWVSKYINSSNFQDRNYMNPPLEVTVNEKIAHNSVQIGNLTIPSEFFEHVYDFFYFDPDKNGVNNFTYSNASLDFEFISRGYFYHSVTHKSSMKHIMKIKEELKSTNKNDDNYDDNDNGISEKIHEEFFKKCHSGDVRIRYLLYGPINVTYFGYVENYTLKIKTISDVPFGITKRGIKKNLKSLVNAHSPTNYYDDFNEYSSVMHFMMKIRIIFFIVKFFLTLFRDHPLKFSYWIVAASFANFTFRSLMWDSDILNLKIWSTALIVHLTVGFVAGAWEITSDQNINNQNRENHPHEQNNDEQAQNHDQQNLN